MSEITAGMYLLTW